MSEIISFYAIRKDAVNSAPKAIQEFVKDYFEERIIFGIPCLVAVQSGDKSPWCEMRDEDYKDGLTDDELQDCGVFTWLSNHPEVVFDYCWS